LQCLAFEGGVERLGCGVVRAGADRAARADVSALLSVAADAAGEELMHQVLIQLPPGYDLLLGGPQA
jgi:hypothetical protein